MNNFRLSTSKNIKIDRDQLLKDIAILLNGPSNYEIIEGRKIIKSLNKLFFLKKMSFASRSRKTSNYSVGRRKWKGYKNFLFNFRLC